MFTMSFNSFNVGRVPHQPRLIKLTCIPYLISSYLVERIPNWVDLTSLVSGNVYVWINDVYELFK